MTVIDAHCHIFPAKIAEKATDAIGDFYTLPMEHVGSPEALLRAMDEAGVSKALVCSTATRAGQVHAINQFICAAEKAAAGRFIGFGTLHDGLSDEETADEIDSIAADLVGVKLHPDFQKMPIDLPRMMPVYEELAKRGLPVLFHIGDDRYDFSSPERLARVCAKIPTLHAIAAHFGGYRVWEKGGSLKDCPNVIFDSSSSLSFLTRDEALRQLEQLTPERVMFGSDFPMWNPAGEIARVKALGLDEATEEKLFHGNLERYILSREGWKTL